MKNVLSAVAITAIVGALGLTVSAKTATVKGQLVDEGCSLTQMKAQKDATAANTEMDACAIDCAKRGEPVALLTADGKVFRVAGGLAANNNAKLIAHMNQTVEITGEVSEKDGKVLIAADTLKPISK